MSRRAINYADPMYNTSIAECSSYLAGCEPENVLLKDNQSLWLSHEGMPQYIVFDLTHASTLHPDGKIVSFGWYCWHSYTTNPKKVQVSVSHDNKNFKIIGTVKGSSSSGLCRFLFPKPAKLESFSYLKFTVLEVFGGDQVYINRFYLFSEGDIGMIYNSPDMTQVSDSISSIVTSSSDDQVGIISTGDDSYANKETKTERVKSNNIPRDGAKSVFMNGDIQMQLDVKKGIQTMQHDANNNNTNIENDENIDLNGIVSLSPSKYYSSKSDYLDKETLDWLYDPIAEKKMIDIPFNGDSEMDAAHANNSKKNSFGAKIGLPSSSVESNDSIVMNYDPGIIPNTVVTPKHEGQRLGVIVHRYGNVEVKVTPTMENEMRFDSKNNMLETFSKTQSTEPVFSNNYPGGRNEEVRYNDIDIDRSKTSLRSDYNASKLKRQLDDMQNEIERLAFGKSFSKLDNLETNRIEKLPKVQQFNSIGSNQIFQKLHGSIANEENVNRTQATISSFASMLEEYNKHVKYLESRLTGAEKHIIALENTIDVLSKENKDYNTTDSPKIRQDIKMGPVDTEGIDSQSFHENMLKVLNSWERDLVSGVLDPHISSIVLKLKRELFGRVNTDLNHIRHEVKRIHEMVDGSIIKHHRQQNVPYNRPQDKNISYNNLDPVIGNIYQNDSDLFQSVPSIDDLGNRNEQRHAPRMNKATGSRAEKDVENFSNDTEKVKYRQLINKLTLKLEEKQRTIEAIKIVREKAKRRNKKKREYKATVQAVVVNNNQYNDSSNSQNTMESNTKTFEIDVEEK